MIDHPLLFEQILFQLLERTVISYLPLIHQLLQPGQESGSKKTAYLPKPGQLLLSLRPLPLHRWSHLQTAEGHQAMHMYVVLQIGAPGVQHSRHTGFAAYISRQGAQLKDRLPGRAEQQVVDQPGVAARQAIQVMR